MANDDQLLAEFVDTFAKLDDLSVGHKEDVPPELHAGWIDGYENWRPTRVQTDRLMLAQFEMFHRQWHKVVCWLVRGSWFFQGQSELLQI